MNKRIKQEIKEALKIYCDRYSRQNKAATRAKNAKAKIIELYFGYLNKNYCQFLPNWSGFGITSDKSKQPNVEFLNQYKQK